MPPAKIPSPRRLLLFVCLLLAGVVSSILWWQTGAPASMAIVGKAETHKGPAAEALLRGVAEARLRYKSFQVELNVDQPEVEPHHETWIADIADEGQLQRFELLAGDGVVGAVVVFDHDEVRSLLRGKHEDLQIRDRADSGGWPGSPIFDPRLLGLTTHYSDSGSPQDYLWCETAKSLAVLGKETLGGAEVWRVQAVGEEAVATFWIEQATSRVHKRTTAWGNGCCEISSYFDGPDKSCPLPSRVHVVSSETGKDISQATFAVTRLRLDGDIPAERFSLASMEIPPGTAVVDNRIHRRLGYWNGHDVEDNPARSELKNGDQETLEEDPKSPNE